MNATPIDHYTRTRNAIAAKIRAVGIRTASKACALNPMRISRYVNWSGADDAITHYLLAALTQTPLDAHRRR